ncbi:SPL family radical SAM protein [Thermodesulfovibrio hydrogeniphilus]
MYIRPFDPWKSELCTCPSKYSLNPYTGCAHGCVYCYASSYIKDFFHCRPKPNLTEQIKKEIKKIPQNSLVSLSNTSDPYPPMESQLLLTRNCLKIFKESNIRVLIITKSDIVCRDIDLIENMKAAVTITITTLKHYQSLEPYAPSPYKRLKALEKLNLQGIPTGLRLDPIIPGINDSEIEEILRLAKSDGIMHVTASTFKPRWDSWQRFKKLFPQESHKLESLYFRQGLKKSNSWYLPESTRKEIILKIKQICDELKLSFASCREGFIQLNSALSCDGSHLIK